MLEANAGAHVTPVTLYTDSYLIRGVLSAAPAGLSDILNSDDRDFVVLEDVKFEEFGTHALVEEAPFAQINLGSVLFGVVAAPVEPADGTPAARGADEVIVSLPPFRVTGRLDIEPRRPLREALTGLEGRFLAVTDATFWSEKLNEPRTSAPMLAFSHARAHIVAPHTRRDVWAGLGAGAGAAAEASGAPLSAEERERIERLAADPWRDLR